MRCWWLQVTSLLFLVSVMLEESSGSKILFISAVCAKSQKGFFDAVISALADNGHHVTVVTTHKSKARPNVRELYFGGMEIGTALPNLFTTSTLSGPQALMEAAPERCSDILAMKEVQDLLKEDFDLGMTSVVFNDCFLSVFHQLNIPYIHVCPLTLMPPASAAIGNPAFSSFIKNPFLHIAYPFTFSERMINAVLDFLGTNYFLSTVIPNMETECRRRGLCPETLPNMLDMRNNASLLFLNSVKTVETPMRPYVPGVVHVGGLHCHAPKPLSPDLENWIADAGEEGFIFFSLGSVVTPSSMPDEYHKILMTAFASIKPKVLWRWDQETMEGLPPNVRLGKWLPQQDILGHPRLRLFITHGGALSTQESMYHGTPVLGLPVFADQMANCMEAEMQGWGRVLKWEELTVDLLRDSIVSVMNDEKLRTEVKRRAALMDDLPLTPAQEVNYWTEYVIRHKGAPHLKSPLHTMTWYQIYNVDVWLTLSGGLLVIVCILLKLLLAIGRFLLCSNSKYKAKRD